MQVKHLSHSSVSMMSKCPRQFFYRYIRGLKIPPGAAMEFGSSYHHSHERNFSNWIQEGEYLEPEEVFSIFRDTWKKRSQRVDWAEEAHLTSASKGILLDTGIDLLKEYIETTLPDRKPKAVEYEFSVQLSEVVRPFVGFIDFVDDSILLDHKTSSRKWNQDRAETEMQPCAYYLGAMTLPNPGEEQREFVFDVAVKSRKPTIQSIHTTRTEAQLLEYIKRIRSTEAMIEAELYPKTDPGNWYCSLRWCGYYDNCMRGVPLRQLRLV